MAKKKFNRSGFIFMIIIILLLGLIIYSYKDKFFVFFKTNINSKKELFGINFDFLKNKKINKEDIINKIKKTDEKKIIENNKSSSSSSASFSSKSNSSKNDKSVKEIIEIDKKNYSSQSKSSSSSSSQSSKSIDIHKTSKKIYFTKIKNEEKLELISVSRNITYTDMPLTETLKTLLSGPTKDEINQNIITNIPDSTKLISVSIRNNIAYINLTKEFELNKYGKEATVAQLKQIVWTTTEFTNVKSVQILIEGKIKDYLGGEGIVINKPITRNDLT